MGRLGPGWRLAVRLTERPEHEGDGRSQNHEKDGSVSAQHSEEGPDDEGDHKANRNDDEHELFKTQGRFRSDGAALFVSA